VFFIAVIFSFWGCRKVSIIEDGLNVSSEKTENIHLLSRQNGPTEIRQWLKEKKIEIGIDSNKTIDKVLAGMLEAEIYTEPFRK